MIRMSTAQVLSNPPLCIQSPQRRGGACEGSSRQEGGRLELFVTGVTHRFRPPGADGSPQA